MAPYPNRSIHEIYHDFAEVDDLEMARFPFNIPGPRGNLADWSTS